MTEVNKFVTIKLRPDDGIHFRWACSKCTGTYTYSRAINNGLEELGVVLTQNS